MRDNKSKQQIRDENMDKNEKSSKNKEQDKNENKENNKNSNKDRTYSPLEFAAKIFKSTKDSNVDIASKLPGGRSVSKKTIKDDSDAQEERDKTDSSGKS